MSTNPILLTSGKPIFWGEIAPCEHIAQFYDHDGVLLDTLAGFVRGGLKAGESVIVIATREHLQALDDRLNSTGVNVAMTRLLDQYITVVAQEALDTFMVKQWPDDRLFFELVMGLINRARAGGRPVRAFGEMVALLWARGDTAATIRLEHLWNKISKEQLFSLFCAYPKTGFTEEASKSVAEICAAHSRII
jgi:MEDS: MEthanogen/methylotroph, DcmR Sensory domain